ncbi:putative mucin TcMUCII [Trypanosoma cruzi]|nr:putative mucin TcMUCII [Trypanosoma cruzi]
MMTTCRLLCALLVLALCCCPSVCVTTTGTAKELNKTHISAPSPSSNPPATTTGQSGLQDVVSAAEPRDVDGDVRGTSGSETQSDGATDKSQKHDNNDTTGPQGSTNKSADQTDQNGEDPAATTTTTTTAPVAPTTTTTTEAPTTTTATTQEPITTTTETPTTTTTRAPSRLREMDGSLSSSAWVCAPLLLAASALVHTAVG